MSLHLGRQKLITKTINRKKIIIMKVRHLFITAVLASLPLFGDRCLSGNIEVIETFDFPGMGKLTQPQKINNRGDIVGAVIDVATGVTKGLLSRPQRPIQPWVRRA